MTNSLLKLFKVIHEKINMQHYVYYDYNDTSLTYFNSNRELLRIRNY